MIQFDTEWLICTRRNWKLLQNEIFSKGAGLFLKISFFFIYFSQIFAIANQLVGFSSSRLANAKEFFNVNIFFNLNINVSRNDYSFKHLIFI